MNKRLAGILCLIAFTLGLCAMVVNGTMEIQVRGSAAGSAKSGYLNVWADNSAGPIHCKTSSGTACYFDGTSSHGLGLAWGQSGGATLSTGTSSYPSPFACTLGGTWYAYSDQTVSFDVLVGGSSITGGGTPPSAAAGSNSGSTSGWSPVAITAGNLLGWKIVSTSGSPTVASVTIPCQ